MFWSLLYDCVFVSDPCSAGANNGGCSPVATCLTHRNGSHTCTCPDNYRDDSSSPQTGVECTSK